MAVLWKRKREIGKSIHPIYRHATNKLLNRSDHFYPVDPGISAHRMIEACDLVISMPFTSTALIAREMGKPTVYYDALKLLRTDDSAAHGIPVLQGPAELEAWI